MCYSCIVHYLILHQMLIPWRHCPCANCLWVTKSQLNPAPLCVVSWGVVSSATTWYWKGVWGFLPAVPTRCTSTVLVSVHHLYPGLHQHLPYGRMEFLRCSQNSIELFFTLFPFTSGSHSVRCFHQITLSIEVVFSRKGKQAFASSKEKPWASWTPSHCAPDLANTSQIQAQSGLDWKGP